MTKKHDKQITYMSFGSIISLNFFHETSQAGSHSIRHFKSAVLLSLVTATYFWAWMKDGGARQKTNSGLAYVTSTSQIWPLIITIKSATVSMTRVFDNKKRYKSQLRYPKTSSAAIFTRIRIDNRRRKNRHSPTTLMEILAFSPNPAAFSALHE